MRQLCGLPYRIRVPLAKLQEKKGLEQESSRLAGLGDGEKLESSESGPDYVRLALTSSVYDMIQETPLQPAHGLSEKLQAQIHLKREDMQPSFSYKLRGAYNLLSAVRASANYDRVVTFSVGSQGHSVAVAAQALGIPATVIMPERTPTKRRSAISRTGASVHVHGKTLTEAQEEAQRLAAADPRTYFVEPHDDPLVIAGQATAGLEIIKQHGAVLQAEPKQQDLDAIFVVAGGSSLLAGVASVVKQIMPSTKVIGVEPLDADLLHRSLLSGHRLSVAEPSHFIDGAAVKQLGPEVFRLCNELVDDIVRVSNDEICAAVQDCFEDTRAMLEPAGAVSIAGIKKYLANVPVVNGTRGNYVAITSDASNIEFDILRFVAERAAFGEEKERLFALRVPDRTGMFHAMYNAVQPRLVTEFVYRHSPHHDDALVYMAFESPANKPLDEDFSSKSLVDALTPLGVKALDITGDEMAKAHSRYLAGGRPGEVVGERVVRFEFPEQPGSLESFLGALKEDWFLTMLHYRNHGGQIGKVLAGVRVPAGQESAFTDMLLGLGFTFTDETNNPIFLDFMR